MVITASVFMRASFVRTKVNKDLVLFSALLVLYNLAMQQVHQRKMKHG